MSSPDYKALYQEANRRAEEERQRAEEERQRAEEERQRAEEERQRAEEERKERNLAEQRAEHERKERNLAEQRAEHEREERNLAEQRAEVLEGQTQKTTLIEYFRLCHTHLSQNISIQTDKSMSTQGDPTTKPNGKLRPNRLLPWTNYLVEQKEAFERLLSAYPVEDMQRVFESATFVAELGERVSLRKLASEGDLQNLQRETVETPVSNIVRHLYAIGNVREEFGLTGEIMFDNHPNALSDNAEEVARRLEQQHLEPSTPRYSSSPLSGLKADQICVYNTPLEEGSLRKLALIVEYKAPHKLPVETLRLGFHAMDLNDVINRNTIPVLTDKPGLFQYHADRVVAAVVTQAFNYMIEGGTQHGYITTGQAFVFLYIPLDDPNTLYYHLTEPNADVDAQLKSFPTDLSFLYRTAVSQVLIFCLLALEAAPGFPGWRQDAINALKIWNISYRDILREIPETVRKSPPPSEYRPQTYRLEERSPIGLRPRKKGKNTAASTCQPEAHPYSTGDHDSTSASDGEPHPPTPTPQAGRVLRKRNSVGRATSGSRSSDQRKDQQRPFCTQKCLRNLAQGGFLDLDCPNTSTHRGPGGKQHQLDLVTFQDLLRKQLTLNRDEDCWPLNLQGARGALFKVTLTSHGYTVAAKGTVSVFVEDLENESKVYDRLRPMQGWYVPVCLGSINLEPPYYYDVGVRIVHMMFLSWAGECLDKVNSFDIRTLGLLKKERESSIQAIHRLGVLHRDLRPPNVLWNSELERVMLIDFERSQLLESDRHPLSRISPNRKTRRQTRKVKGDSSNSNGTCDKGTVGSRDSRLTQEQNSFAQILSYAIKGLVL